MASPVTIPTSAAAKRRKQTRKYQQQHTMTWMKQQQSCSSSFCVRLAVVSSFSWLLLLLLLAPLPVPVPVLGDTTDTITTTQKNYQNTTGNKPRRRRFSNPKRGTESYSGYSYNGTRLGSSSSSSSSRSHRRDSQIFHNGRYFDRMTGLPVPNPYASITNTAETKNTAETTATAETTSTTTINQRETYRRNTQLQTITTQLKALGARSDPRLSSWLLDSEDACVMCSSLVAAGLINLEQEDATVLLEIEEALKTTTPTYRAALVRRTLTRTSTRYALHPFKVGESPADYEITHYDAFITPDDYEDYEEEETEDEDYAVDIGYASTSTRKQDQQHNRYTASSITSTSTATITTTTDPDPDDDDYDEYDDADPDPDDGDYDDDELGFFEEEVVAEL